MFNWCYHYTSVKTTVFFTFVMIITAYILLKYAACMETMGHLYNHCMVF